MHCAAGLDSAAAILRGCSSSVMCYMVMDSKVRGKEPKETGLGSAMKPLSIVFFHPKVNDAGACVQKVAPAARACRQLLLVRHSRAGTASPPGNTLANPGSQPP